MQDVTPDKLKELLDAGQTVFLKLWQKGCGPCKLSEVATKRMQESGQFKDLLFAKISTDDHPEMVETAGTDILPVFFLFKDKKLVGKNIGFKGLKALEEFTLEKLNA